MQRFPFYAIVYALVLVTVTLPASQTVPPSTADRSRVDATEYTARRERVVAAMREQAGDQAILLLQASSPDQFARDVDYPYRPDDDLFYLTGISEPGFALVLSVEEVEGSHAVLFYHAQNPVMVIWEGARLGAAGASQKSGVPQESIREIDALGEFLQDLFHVQSGTSFHHHRHDVSPRTRRPLFYDTGADFAPGTRPTAGFSFLLETLGSGAFFVDLHQPGELIHPLRQVKSAGELEILQTAIDITCKALREAMITVRPQQHEYEIRAVIEKTFLENGSHHWGFPSIVGTGPNTCILHYQKYDRQSEAGELVLMDVGAEYGFYSADVTRTIPLSGRFSPRQRDVYSIVLTAQKKAIAAVRPGVTMGDVHSVALESVGEGLKELGLIDDTGDARTYFPHGTSHGLGLNVHDPMPERALTVGMVITVEPGVYIPDEAIGIRIEDDVLVTKDGCHVLSTAAPKEIDEIEALMNAKSF